MKKYFCLITIVLLMISVSRAQTAYVNHFIGGYVSVINVATDIVTDTISFGANSSPGGVSVSGDGTKVYVADWGLDSVYVINTATNIVAASIYVAHSPGSITILPDGSKVYVATVNWSTVSVITTATNTVSANVNVGGSPRGIVASPDGSKVYVGNYSPTGNVSIINTAADTVMAIIIINQHLKGISISPDGSKLYVAGDSIFVINTNTNAIVATIPVGSGPYGVSGSPDGSKVYVANCGSNTVSVINTVSNTVSSTIQVGVEPYGISVSPDGTKVYVENYSSITLSVINTVTNTVSNTVNVGPYSGSLGNFISTYTQTGIASQNIEASTISIYPNPTNGQFTIESTKYKIESIKIINVLGEEIKSMGNMAISNSATIDLSGVGKGIYFAEIKTGKGIVNKKIIVE